jgi:hypothetical protein
MKMTVWVVRSSNQVPYPYPADDCSIDWHACEEDQSGENPVLAEDLVENRNLLIEDLCALLTLETRRPFVWNIHARRNSPVHAQAMVSSSVIRWE